MLSNDAYFHTILFSTQMYHSSPYPPPRDRAAGSSGNASHLNGTAGHPSAIYPGGGYRRIIAPTSTFTHITAQTLGSSRNEPTLVLPGLSSQASASITSTPNRTKRYSYKSQPVVYTAISKSALQHHVEDLASPSPSSAPAIHQLITPSAPGAIVDFFKEV